MSISHLDPHGRPDDPHGVRRLLSRAAPDVTTPVDAGGDLERGRAALGRRRSVVGTLAVGAGTALVAAAAVLVPQSLAGVLGGGAAPAVESGTPGPIADPTPSQVAVVPPTDAVPLVPGPQQRADEVVATLVPQGWDVLRADSISLVLSDSADPDDALVVTPAAVPSGPPVLRGVGDFERIAGSRASYYLLDTSDGPSAGAARPTMVLELTHGTWALVSASPRLGWGIADLTAFSRGLRAPFSCEAPCEVPLAP